MRAMLLCRRTDTVSFWDPSPSASAKPSMASVATATAPRPPVASGGAGPLTKGHANSRSEVLSRRAETLSHRRGTAIPRHLVAPLPHAPSSGTRQVVSGRGLLVGHVPRSLLERFTQVLPPSRGHRAKSSNAPVPASPQDCSNQKTSAFRGTTSRRPRRTTGKRCERASSYAKAREILRSSAASVTLITDRLFAIFPGTSSVRAALRPPALLPLWAASTSELTHKCHSQIQKLRPGSVGVVGQSSDGS